MLGLCSTYFLLKSQTKKMILLKRKQGNFVFNLISDIFNDDIVVDVIRTNPCKTPHEKYPEA